MKVIFKPTPIKEYEAIKITEDMIGRVLTDTETLKQEIVKENDKLILKAHEIDKTDKYESIQDINVFIELGDYLVKNDKGYQKPVYEVYELDKQLERAIKKINEVK